MKPTVEELETVHLCSDCIYCPAICRPAEILFGTGLGNDNVVKCDQFEAHGNSNG